MYQRSSELSTPLLGRSLNVLSRLQEECLLWQGPSERMCLCGEDRYAYRPEDIFCLKKERKVAKDHTASLGGDLHPASETVLVAFKVRLHIHPGERLLVCTGVSSSLTCRTRTSSGCETRRSKLSRW